MNIEPGTHSDPHASISNSDLADGSLSLIDHISALDRPMMDIGAEPATGAVVGGNLLAFADGLSRQNREDVMDSILFATLKANKYFNPETQTQDWYANFSQTCSSLGWTSTGWSLARYRSSHRRFTMEQAAIEILGSAIAGATLPGPASAVMLKVAADTVSALKAQEKPLRLFDRQTKSHNGANFRIGACVESPDGGVNMAMGTVNFLTSANVTSVLFWEWNSAEVQTFRGENVMSFNTRHYAIIRKNVQQALAKHALAAIEEFDI
jgi:hypothetical protein